jgi:PAS domain S-box-containing protein
VDLIADHVRELLDSGPDALVVADESGVIAYVNRQTEVLFGFERNELRGKKIEMLLPERLRATHPSHRRSYGTTPRVRPMGGNLELYARRRDGSEFPVEISLSPIHTKQGLLISSTIRDISDRHQILEDLRAARNEAERANRAKSTFLATASHDLRQPLQSLILLNSVLQKTSTDSRAIEAAAAQQEALASMSELVNALLDISKLECGAIKPVIADCAVRGIFRHLRASFEEEARAKGLALIVDESDDIVHTDAGLLGQIVQNLLANAIRYTREGSVHLRCVSHSAGVRIEVFDTGVGIAVEDQERIFEEFHQLLPAPGTRREGLGLGLAIVRRIAQLLGCTIEVESEPGRGSCFSLTVPRGCSISQRPVFVSNLVIEKIRNALIVLVDDEVAVARATQMLLELEGHAVLSARGLDSALALIDQHGIMPDLIVSDFHLGSNVSGIDVIRELRELAGFRIPAILVTGDTSPRRANAENIENLEILSKPVDAAEFLDCIDRLLSADLPQYSSPRISNGSVTTQPISTN